jgi:S-adenosylhomocysteine hydrolase
MVTTQLSVMVNMNAAITADIAVTSEQSLVSQDNLVMSLEIKTFTLNSDNARSFYVTLRTIFTVAATISGDDIT